MGRVKDQAARDKDSIERAARPRASAAMARPQMSRDERQQAIMMLRRGGFEELRKAADQGKIDRAPATGTLDKNELIEVPFAIVDVEFRLDEKYGSGGEWVIVTALLEDDRTEVFTDQGVGIGPALRAVIELRQKNGQEVEFCKNPYLVEGGLKRNDYVNKAGIPGTTFYLNGASKSETATTSSKKNGVGRSGRSEARA